MGPGPKRKQSSTDKYISLAEEVGPVTWLRVTNSKDSKNKRQTYCVNFYSGSVDDDEAVSVVVSGRSQLQISIPDHEFANSSIPKEEYALQKIIATVKQRVQSQQSEARFLKSRMHFSMI